MCFNIYDTGVGAKFIAWYLRSIWRRAVMLLSSYAIHEQKVFWTDGACANNQDQRFRRAGAGIFYGTGHPMNASMILPGYVQSNQRAELLAVVVACMRDPRPLDIRTDSEYVCNGFAALSSWKESGWKGDHADLWNLSS